MKFKRISAIILAISLILTVNATAHDSSAENPASAQAEAELQTSYDRTNLTPAEERAIIKRWLEEYPEATVGVCNGMLVLDTRPLSDFSTESEPACMPGFSMEEYLEENPMTEADDIVSQTEEQPAELSVYDKITIEFFNSMTEEQRLKAIQENLLTGLSVEAMRQIVTNMTETEMNEFVNKYLKLDAALSQPDLQTSYDRTNLTPAEECAIIERWLEEYPEATVGVCNGMLVLDTRPLSDFSTESEPACMPGFSAEDNAEIEANTISPRIKVDDDNRIHISKPSVAPFSYTAYIVSRFKTASNTYLYAQGTAFFVDKDLLLTAGHCTYHPDYGYADKIYIFPGGCESGISYSVSYTAYASNQWVSDAKDKNFHDYGVIKVLVDISPGYYALSEKTNSQLNSKNITLYGFPNDKPYSGTKPVSGIGDFYEFWISTGSIDSSILTNTNFSHTADTQTCNSG